MEISLLFPRPLQYLCGNNAWQHTAEATRWAAMRSSTFVRLVNSTVNRLCFMSVARRPSWGISAAAGARQSSVEQNSTTPGEHHSELTTVPGGPFQRSCRRLISSALRFQTLTERLIGRGPSPTLTIARNLSILGIQVQAIAGVRTTSASMTTLPSASLVPGARRSLLTEGFADSADCGTSVLLL